MTENTDLVAGRYRLLARIGTGGMGVVWRARDELLGRTVAVKELASRSLTGGSGAILADDGARRAMREARIAARLHHPHVIGVYDIVDHDGRPFLVMEYLESRSLAQLAATGVLLPPQEVAQIGAQLASALKAAHDAGIVHRDVKPGNVLLAEDGEVKLTDFGISRAVGDATLTASGVLLGTVGYIAPEVAQGEPADSRSDVYSLGATLYAAVEGHPPFGNEGNAVAQLYRIVHEGIIPARHAGALEPVLLWMLERDPALRPTMPEAERALAAVGSGPEDAEAALLAADRTVPFVPTPATADRTEVDAAVPPPAAPPSLPPPSTAQPATAPPSDAPPTDAPPATAPRSRFPQGRRRRALIAVLAAALLLGLGGWGLALALHGHSAAKAPAASTAPPSHAATSRPASASASPSPSSQPSKTTVSKSPAAPPATAASAAPPPSRADQLSATIVDYYRLMPGNLTQAWTWMTPDYQQNHAGGWDGYTSFWSQIQRVAVSGVTASPPSTVTATIDYYYKNGSFVEERTQFGLVSQQGRWLIASSSVLSHRG